MDSQNLVKHQLSKMFRSCKSRSTSDVIERPRQHYQLFELFSPKPHHPVFSMCGPLYQSETEKEFPRRKITDRCSLMHCPPVTPLVTWQERGRKDCKKGAKRDKKEKIKDNKTIWNTKISNNNYYDWSTSDDDMDTNDDEETTLFSSDSSDSFHRPTSHHNRRNKPMKPETDDQTDDKKGFAVVKRSNDPYRDFRSSMVEMIVEKQIFRTKELEGLLDTFLSLNSFNHHKVIVEVFTEILDALFSD